MGGTDTHHEAAGPHVKTRRNWAKQRRNCTGSYEPLQKILLNAVHKMQPPDCNDISLDMTYAL